MAAKNALAASDKTAQITPQQVVNDGILKVIAATGIDVQKNRYKAMRAIAWQAFANAIEAEKLRLGFSDVQLGDRP